MSNLVVHWEPTSGQCDAGIASCTQDAPPVFPMFFSFWSVYNFLSNLKSMSGGHIYNI